MFDYILPFIVLISVVVFIHEYGHYYFARKYGVKVTRFLIFGLPFLGLDKELFGWTDKSGTRWSIGFFPLGGFVDIFGSRDYLLTNEEIEKKYSFEERKYLLQSKKIYQKILFALGGPLANFLTAIIIFFMVAMFVGKDFSPAMINKVAENSPAENAGLMPNDQIIKINNSKIDSILDVSRMILITTSESIKIDIIRKGNEKSFVVTPKYISDVNLDSSKSKRKRRIIGITLTTPNGKLEPIKLGPANAIYYSIKETLFLCKWTSIHIWHLISGQGDVNNLSGPIGIAKMSGEVAKGGLIPFIQFIALISISLGFINLLPIPVLDGGHIMFFCFEKILGRPVKRKTQETLFQIGFVLLMTMMFFAFYIDFQTF
tara:strand:- start:228 stop:1346 length:1119 start_codon:yes stop_codon:yes gene_type:complete